MHERLSYFVKRDSALHRMNPLTKAVLALCIILVAFLSTWYWTSHILFILAIIPLSFVGRVAKEFSTTALRLIIPVRGVLKLLVLRSERTPAQSATLLGEAMALSSQTAEKLSVLSLLPYFPSKESLDVAQAALRDQEVANEARIALDQVNEALKLK